MNDISSTTPPNTLRQRRPLHTGRPDRCDRVALVLQGGGALGAYQAGVYQAMHEANIMPDWVAGVSIGAINAAIIAGNPPHRRIAQLHAFWDLITERKIWAYTPDGDVFRKARNATSSMMTMVGGQPGFFTPRSTSPWLSFTGAQGATSYYDSAASQRDPERPRRFFDHQRSGDPFRRRRRQRAHRQLHLFRQLRGGDRT